MKDTTFYLTKEQLPRLATAYKKTGDKLDPAEIMMFSGQDLTSRKSLSGTKWRAFSQTASDYGTFARMILNQGTLDGHQYLKPQTVTQMTTVQSGDLVTGFYSGVTAGDSAGASSANHRVSRKCSPPARMATAALMARKPGSIRRKDWSMY